MRLKGKQLDGFNAALREGNQGKAMSELQGACARAEGIVPFASASGSAVLESAEDLESSARTLIKHRHTAPEWMWENLANSVNRLNAARQAYEPSQLPNDR